MKLKRLLAVGLLSLFFGGCVAGVRDLGTTTLRDGTIRQYVQVGSEGQDGPKTVIIEAFNCGREFACLKDGHYFASGPSLTSDILKGVGPATALAAGAVGAMAVRHPDISVNVLEQGQGQGQGQNQGQSNFNLQSQGQGQSNWNSQGQGQLQLQGQSQ